MRTIRLFILVLLAPAAALAEPVDELADALTPLQQMQGTFTQRQYDETGNLLLESSGEFRLLRPDYFAWDIRSPDSQLVVAGPDFVWHHDRDLETVTRRPIASIGDLAPLQVLGGDIDTLRTAFTVTRTETGNFLLSPVNAQASFIELEVALEAGVVTQMRVLDTLEQTLDVSFGGIETDTTLTAADFAFTPPPDADLFYHD